jgi:hypothetical protein
VKRNTEAFQRFVDALEPGVRWDERALCGPLRVPRSSAIPDVQFLLGKATRCLNWSSQPAT